MASMDKVKSGRGNRIRSIWAMLLVLIIVGTYYAAMQIGIRTSIGKKSVECSKMDPIGKKLRPAHAQRAIWSF